MKHLSDTELAEFLDRRLSPVDLRRVEAHIDVCGACRSEVIELDRITKDGNARRRLTSARPLRRAWIPAVAAAGIVAMLVLPRLSTSPSSSDDRVRAAPFGGEGLRQIDIVSPADDVSVPSGPVVLTWHAVQADVYRVSLLTESGTPLWTKDTPDSSVTLPANVGLRPGQAYFWRVEAIASGIAATTRVHRLRIAP